MFGKKNKDKRESEWRAQLTDEQFRVLRQSGTERPFSGEYWNTKADGSYHCIACGQLLFESETKFDAGCGWPSFFAAAGSKSVTMHRDTSHGMVRTEVKCTGCNSHLGHVFPDGPLPTGDRFCINSVCLQLKASSPPDDD